MDLSSVLERPYFTGRLVGKLVLRKSTVFRATRPHGGSSVEAFFTCDHVKKVRKAARSASSSVLTKNGRRWYFGELYVVMDDKLAERLYAAWPSAEGEPGKRYLSEAELMELFRKAVE